MPFVNNSPLFIPFQYLQFLLFPLHLILRLRPLLLCKKLFIIVVICVSFYYLEGKILPFHH